MSNIGEGFENSNHNQVVDVFDSWAIQGIDEVI
jgi:hypothetical protein